MLRTERPEILKMIQDINFRLNNKSLLNLHDVYSSDSSSSSSSSSDSSDSDEENNISQKEDTSSKKLLNALPQSNQNQLAPARNSPLVSIEQSTFQLQKSENDTAEILVWTNNDANIFRKRLVNITKCFIIKSPLLLLIKKSYVRSNIFFVFAN